MTTTKPPIKVPSTYEVSIENHKKIFTYLKATAKYLESPMPASLAELTGKFK